MSGPTTSFAVQLLPQNELVKLDNLGPKLAANQ
jgi:hypothetical protein